MGKIKQCRWPNLYQVNDPRLLPFSVQCYIVTIYKIETLRMRSLHSMEFLCLYLIDQRLQVHDTQILLELFFNEILKHNFLDYKYLRIPRSIQAEHARTLLLLAAHRIKNVRIFARKWLQHLLKVVPYLVSFIFTTGLGALIGVSDVRCCPIP
jgi:hypothetical protein